MTGPKPNRRTPTPAPPPKLPTPADPSVEQEAQKRRKAEMNAGGARSTILTSSKGVEEEKTRKKTLLGG